MNNQHKQTFLTLLVMLLALSVLLSGCTASGKYTEATFRAPEGAWPSITETTPPGYVDPHTTESEETSVSETAKPTETEVKLAGNTIFYDGSGALPTDSIEKAMAQAITDLGMNSGAYALAFLDFTTGETWGLNVLDQYEAASIIKLPAALYTFEQLAIGGCQLDELLIIDEDDLELGTGPISEAGVGVEYTLEEIVQASIMHSDNTAFHALLRFWQDRCPEGWLLITLDHHYGLNYNGSRAMSPSQCLGILQELYRGKDDAYSLLIHYMENTSYEAMAAKYIPVPVARKYGKLGDLYHDVGLVLGDRPFAFAIFTESLSNPQESIAAFTAAWYNTVLAD